MATVGLKAKVRGKVGKESAKRDRTEGLVPAVLYGEGEQPLALAVDNKELYSVLHTRARGNVIIDLAIEGSGRGECKAIIREIQRHPIHRGIIHVDFQHISMTKEIVVRVPIVVTGESVGVKSHGGILEFLLREIEVQCLPTAIPEQVTVDVSNLDIGDSLQVKHLAIEGMKLVTDADASVITVVAPTVIEEVKVEVPVEGAEAAPVEGAEGEEKKEEGAEKKAEKKEEEPKAKGKPEK
jgi:large subunit ribosomal protein L25